MHRDEVLQDETTVLEDITKSYKTNIGFGSNKENRIFTYDRMYLIRNGK